MTPKNIGEPDFLAKKISPTPQISLDLHGFSVLAAIDETESFLEKCRAGGLFHARIITGRGTGALFSAILNLLKEKKAGGEIQNISPKKGFFLVILR